jgi:hypothetical protein
LDYIEQTVQEGKALLNYIATISTDKLDFDKKLDLQVAKLSIQQLV